MQRMCAVLIAISLTPVCAAQTSHPAHSANTTSPQRNSNQPASSKSLIEICSIRARQCWRTGAAGTQAPVPLRATSADQAGNTCSGLLTNRSGPGSAASIAKQLDGLERFTVQADGDALLYVFASGNAAPKAQDSDLEKWNAQLATVLYVLEAGRGSVDVDLPRAAALSADGVTAVQQLAPEGITVSMPGRGVLRISAPTDPQSCKDLALFLRRVRRFAEPGVPESPIATLTYLEPAASAAAVGGTQIPLASGGTAPGILVTAIHKSEPASAETQSPGASNPPKSGSSTTAAPPASLVLTATSAPAATNAAGVAANPASTPLTITMAASPASEAAPVTTAGGSMKGSSPPSGDNEMLASQPDALAEDKRVLAMLDLPQPQVLLNAWVVQSSTSDPRHFGEMSDLLRTTVAHYDAALQHALFAGWQELAQAAQDDSFYNKRFADYLTLQTVWEPRGQASDMSAQALVRGTAGVKNAAEEQRLLTTGRGICPQGQYCLGYTALLRPVGPRLTDMLLALIAAQKPAVAGGLAIDRMEDGQKSRFDPPQKDQLPASLRARFSFLDDHFDKSSGTIQPALPCDQRDQVFLLNTFRAEQAGQGAELQPVPLECLRESLYRLGADSQQASQLPLQLGDVRAALADFLFNYKLSQQYPHDFDPYDLTRSAQQLDAELAPFIEAFNQDVAALHGFTRDVFVYLVQQRHLGTDKNAFLDTGIITVRTTSGAEANIHTATESFLNTSKAPTISQLASSIASHAASGPPLGVLGNMTTNEAQVVLGALAAYQTTELHIGRKLDLVVRPRSLLDASAAELDVQLSSGDGPSHASYWTPGSTGSAPATPDLSHIAESDIATHVRVDSIRLFEISSFTTELSKGRDKFPLLPPFVELPYIGTLAGIPLKAAREYHSSNAILSATVVPTATDIAYSVRFAADRVVLGTGDNDSCSWSGAAGQTPCLVRRATSLDDVGGDLVREIHHRLLACLQAEGQQTSAATSPACESLNFAQMLHEEP